MAITKVTNSLVAVNAIQGTLIADNAITSVHIAQNQVTSVQIPDGSITSTQIAANSIDTAELVTGSIDTIHIGDSQVTTAKIADLNVTTGKIANNAITAAKIPDGSITETQLSSSAAPTFGNITTTGSLRGPASFTIDPAAVGDNTGTVVIAGDLQVDGNSTTINSSTLLVEDKNITLARTASTASAANTAGISIAGANADLTYFSTGDKWSFNKGLEVTQTLSVGPAPSTVIGVYVSKSLANGLAAELSNTQDSTGSGLVVKGGNNSSTYSADFRDYNNATLMRIRGDGFVGIGTASPDRQLELEGQGVLRLNATGSDTDPGIDFNTSAVNDMQIRYRGGTDKLAVYSYGTTSDVFTIQKADGNVGIGTTSPSSAAGFDAKLQLESANPMLVYKETDQSNKWEVGAWGGNYVVWNGTDERMRINSSGNVGIGGSPVGAKLQVQADGISVKLDGTANTTRSIFFRNTTSSNPAQIYADGSLRLFTEDAGTDIRFHTNSNGTNNERMRIDSSGKVGIGQTSPYFPLHVQGENLSNGQAYSTALLFDTSSATTGTGGGLALGGYSNGTGGDVYHFGNIQGIKENSTAGNYASAMLFSTRANGATPTEKMRIDSEGNVGIGASSLLSKLHIDGAEDSSGGITLTAGAQAHYWYLASDYVNVHDIGTGSASAAHTWHINGSEKVRIDASGDVRLAGNATGAALIKGISGNQSNRNAGGYPQFTFVGNEGTGMRRPITNILAFDTSGDESMRIDESGNVGIGTVSPTSWASYTDSGATVLQLQDTNQRARVVINGGNGAHLDLVDYAGSTNDKHMNIAVDSGVLKFGSLNDAGNAFVKNNIMVMDLGTGTVGIGTTNPTVNLVIGGTSDSARIIPATDNVGYIGESSHRWQAIYAVTGSIQTSDEREKTEIKETTLGLNFIKDLKPVSYKWIDGEQQNKGKDEREHQGLIAQQVAETVEKHGIDKNTFGGLDIQKTEKYDDFHGMSYDQFVAPLIKAIQELSAKNDALEARITELEG